MGVHPAAQVSSFFCQCFFPPAPPPRGVSLSHQPCAHASNNAAFVEEISIRFTLCIHATRIYVARAIRLLISPSENLSKWTDALHTVHGARGAN